VTVPAASRYRALRLHAKGGLGEVHVAVDAELGRRVALKRIRPEYADQEACRRRFLREAEITALLEHPGVVPVHGLVYDADGRPNYVMRFLSGESLQAALDRFHSGKFGPDDAARRLEFRRLLGAFVAVCHTVGYAHSRGVIHRDLKPANVMLGEFGEALVVDWGLAKRLDRPSQPAADAGEATPLPNPDGEKTEQGQVLGTPAYMSPEQAVGRWDAVGPASDIYGLGATLYHLLTGQPPVRGPSRAEVLAQVRRGQLVRPRQANKHVPAALEAVCLKAMALQPQDRYASAAALAADVERFLADEPVVAYREPWGLRVRRWVRRHKLAVAAAAVALLGVLASLAVGLAVLGIKNGELLQANEDLTQANAAKEAARQEAERRFGQARQAVDEFFTEVSTNPRLLVKEPGTQAVRRALLEKAKAYYESFLAERGEDPTLRLEAANAYRRLATITGELNPGLAAVPLYRRAVEGYRQLVHDHPDVPDYADKLADALAYLGMTLRDGGQGEAARTALEEARDRRRQLVHDHPSTAAYAASLVHVVSNLATLHRLRGQDAEALRAYEEARDLGRRLTRDQPGEPQYAYGLAGTLNSLGIHHQLSQRRPEALRAYEEARDLGRRLTHDHPDVPAYTELLAIILVNLGDQYREVGRGKEALQALEEARDQNRQLVTAHPNVPRYAERLAATFNNLGVLHFYAGRKAQAKQDHEEALVLRRRLTHDYPDVPEYAMNFGGCYCNIGDILRDQGQLAAALDYYDQALRIFQDVVRKYSRNQDAEDWLIEGHKGRARTLGQMGRHAEAAAEWGHASERERGPHKDFLRLRRAASLARAGRSAEAAGEVDAVTAAARLPPNRLYDAACVYAVAAVPDDRAHTEIYAARAIALLGHAVQAGFKDFALLRKDADLNALRGRPDFQRLLWQLCPPF
jgi:serine/threonine-protein kinase